MKKLFLLLLCVPLLFSCGENEKDTENEEKNEENVQKEEISVFGYDEWISDNPIDLGSNEIKGFVLYKHEGVMFNHFKERSRVYPSSFNYTIFDKYLYLEIIFSAGLIKEGEKYRIYYKTLGNKIELSYNNQKSIYYKNKNDNNSFMTNLQREDICNCIKDKERGIVTDECNDLFYETCKFVPETNKDIKDIKLRFNCEYFLSREKEENVIYYKSAFGEGENFIIVLNTFDKLELANDEAQNLIEKGYNCGVLMLSGVSNSKEEVFQTYIGPFNKKVAHQYLNSSELLSGGTIEELQ